MSKFHPENERRKHEYALYLEQAKGLSTKSADLALAAIAQFEDSTGHRDFKLFHVQQALRFKRLLKEERSNKTGKPLSQATINARLIATKNFFIWLAGLPGYRRNITYADCEYFNPRDNDMRVTRTDVPRQAADLDQVKYVIGHMQHATDLEKRNRAIMAVALIGCFRIEALTSLRVGHVDLQKRTVLQDAKVVATKFRKTQLTDFCPVGDDIEAIVREWVTFLKKEHHFGPDEPLFPASKIENVDGIFQATGLDRSRHIGAQAVRDIFKAAYEAVGLPYYHPHTIRHTLVRFAETVCTTQEQFVAFSQNLGHANPATTLGSYSKITRERQTEILQNFAAVQAAGGPKPGFKPNGEPEEETLEAVFEYLKRKAS